MAIFALFTVVICVLSFVAMWKLYVKAGEPGWKSLIPYYSYYVLFKIARVKQTLFWLSFAGVLVGTLLSAVLGVVGLITTLVFAVCLIISTIWCYIKLFERFGLKAFGWIFVILFMPIIGIAVIAFNPCIEYDFE